MINAVKLKSKDAEALQEFLERVRQLLGINLIEVKLEDQVLDIAFDVNLKRDVYVSPRVIDRATLSDPVWSITPFLRAIAKEGVCL